MENTSYSTSIIYLLNPLAYILLYFALPIYIQEHFLNVSSVLVVTACVPPRLVRGQKGQQCLTRKCFLST